MPEEDIAFSGAGGSWEPHYGCWELKLGSLEDQQVLLTTKPSFTS